MRIPAIVCIAALAVISMLGQAPTSGQAPTPMAPPLDQIVAHYELANLSLADGLSEADPHLPANKLDLILMVDVYHELSQPQAMLDAMRTSMKSDARLVLLEYRKEDPSIPILPDHKMSVADAKLEVEAEGFHLDRVIETLPASIF